MPSDDNLRHMSDSNTSEHMQVDKNIVQPQQSATNNAKEQKLAAPELEFYADNPYIDNSIEWAQIERPIEELNFPQFQTFNDM
ncbi:16053_t:CDS:2 [Cetraspora pellucida]|uniref:16053_t:CDS:1 n=1 Tax=Cetraspora pellucida TaxID=1433469 RepID=A0A9N9C5Q5_9GLOM|nr:16053_t:CDS:2 [Cetraspora pellucida]